MSEPDIFSKNSSSDLNLSSDNDRNKQESIINNTPLPQNVTVEDVGIQKKLKNLKIRMIIYTALLFICIAPVCYFALLEKFGKKMEMPLTFSIICFIGMMLFCILLIVGGYRHKKLFKEGLVEPVLNQIFNYNKKASKKFKKNKRLIHETLNAIGIRHKLLQDIRISDCIIGSINNSQFAFVNLVLFSSTQEGVLDFKGQAIFMPVKYASSSYNQKPLPPKAEKLIRQLSEKFKDATALDADNPLGNQTFSASDSDHTDATNEKLTLDQAKQKLKKFGAPDLVCNEQLLILALENKKDPFEVGKDDLKKIEQTKTRIINEASWVKNILQIVKQTGIV